MSPVDFFRLARLEHGVLAGLAVTAAYLYTAEELEHWRALMAFLSTVLAEAFLFVTNDIANMEEDRINRPGAPLVKGSVSVGEAWAAALLALVSGVAIALLLGPLPLSVYLAAITVGYMYNVKLKRVPLLGNISVAFTTSMVYVYGASVAGFARNMDVLVLLFAATFLANIGREVVKSVADYEGDLRAGIITVVHLLGPKRSLYLAWAAVGAAILVSVPLVLASWPQPLSLAVMATSALLAYACLASAASPRRGKGIMLFGFSVTLVGLFLSGI